MLGVSSESFRLMSAPAGVPKDIDKAPIVSSGDQSLIVGPVDSVDVRAVLALGNDTLGGPGVLGVAGRPDGALVFGSAVLVLGAVGDVEEEQLVGAADGPQLGAVLGPVDGDDERVVLGAGPDQAVAGIYVVDSDLVVVGADRYLGAVGRVLDGFDPLLRVPVRVDLVVDVVQRFAHSEVAVVAADRDVPVGGVYVAGSRALGGGLLREGGGSVLYSSHVVGDLARSNAGGFDGVVDLYLVVVGSGDHSIVGVSQAPDFSVGVGLHHNSLVGSVFSSSHDVSISESDNHLGSAHINGPDEGAELDLGDLAGGGGVGDEDVAVFAPGVELAGPPDEGADEAAVVAFDRGLGGPASAVPDVDGGLGGAGVGVALVVPADAGVVGDSEAAVDALLAGAVDVPELHVLDTSSGEHGLALLLGEGDIVDGVSTVALVLELPVARVGVEHVHVVVVAPVHQGHVVSALRDGDSGHSSAASVALEPRLLLSSGSVPGETYRSLADLASGCDGSVC
eukprot:CAMPEP_0205803292 /NCGR_PEP_ID=MMETSP0205-20121125/5893_1 /ASSEMBLY_ACC=CAM_ASM_000278 /TAXON_ID=36767 /ORGANISM="Euplotes focardii, Strain TN1" /LENGTH=507 /DNA_ID=CAMNT_0053071119 /DNA_START=45 /DNA_END=1569 /DNA_ORIENTATION=+